MFPPDFVEMIDKIEDQNASREGTAPKGKFAEKNRLRTKERKYSKMRRKMAKASRRKNRK